MSLPARAYACAPLLLVLATLGWAGNTVAGKLAAGEISPMTLIFLRWGMVAVLLGAAAPRQIRAAWPLARRHLGWLLFMGGSISLFNGLFYWAAHYTLAVNLGIIQSMIPAFILLGAYLIFRDRIGRLQFAGLLATLAGGALIVSRGAWQTLLALTFNAGDILMLVACLFYASYTLGLRGRPAIGAFVMMWFIAAGSWVATLPLLAAEVALGAARPPDSAAGWLILAYIALVPSFLSQVFFMRGVDLIGPARAGLYANLIPVFATMLGVLLLGEALRAYHFAALLLVFGGIYLFEKGKAAALAGARL